MEILRCENICLDKYFESDRFPYFFANIRCEKKHERGLGSENYREKLYQTIE